MIVLDASVVVELLAGRPSASAIRQYLAASDQSFIVPHLLDIEVLSALRGLVTAKAIAADRVTDLLDDLILLPVLRYDHLPLTSRIWELRHNFTAYDAAYIALAEATDSILCTMDGKLAKGHRADVMLFSAGNPA